MNAEYLLDAIGQLDDELVREAERYRRPKVRYGRLMGLAACFAVAVALGYVLTHIGGMNGGSAPSYSAGGGNGGGAPASGNSAPSTSDGADTPHEPEQPLGSASSSQGGENAEAPGGAQEVPHGTIFVRGASGNYILTGEVLAELPEGGEPVLLGTLSALYPDSPSPCTTVEEYAGLNLWAEDGDIIYAVYVELPEGGFARAELVEP